MRIYGFNNPIITCFLIAKFILLVFMARFKAVVSYASPNVRMVMVLIRFITPNIEECRRCIICNSGMLAIHEVVRCPCDVTSTVASKVSSEDAIFLRTSVNRNLRSNSVRVTMEIGQSHQELCVRQEQRSVVIKL